MPRQYRRVRRIGHLARRHRQRLVVVQRSESIPGAAHAELKWVCHLSEIETARRDIMAQRNGVVPIHQRIDKKRRAALERPAQQRLDRAGELLARDTHPLKGIAPRFYERMRLRVTKLRRYSRRLPDRAPVHRDSGPLDLVVDLSRYGCRDTQVWQPLEDVRRYLESHGLASTRSARARFPARGDHQRDPWSHVRQLASPCGSLCPAPLPGQPPTLAARHQTSARVDKP